MTELPGTEDTTNELIDALRAEIRNETSDEIGDVGAGTPEEIQRLIGLAAVPKEVALALDDLLVEGDTLSGEFHARLMSRVRQEIGRHASAPAYLEQMVGLERERKMLTVQELASRIETSSAVIEGIETARSGFGDVSEQAIAAWIDELDLDLDLAASALESSLLKPAAAYQGAEGRRSKREVRAVVDRVRNLVIERRNHNP